MDTVIGIPIALWLSNFQRTREENERKKETFRHLKEERIFNTETINGWKKKN